jgi:hypothetical protein
VLIHEEPAEYSSWLRLIYLIPACLLIGAVLLASSHENEGAFVLLGEGAFISLLFYFIMPRKYQIHHDKLVILLGTPFSINIPLSSIKEVKRSSGSKAFVYSGVRFATSVKNVIEILRVKGSNYVISPQNGDLFVEQLNLAIKSELQNRNQTAKSSEL